MLVRPAPQSTSPFASAAGAQPCDRGAATWPDGACGRVGRSTLARCGRYSSSPWRRRFRSSWRRAAGARQGTTVPQGRQARTVTTTIGYDALPDGTAVDAEYALLGYDKRCDQRMFGRAHSPARPAIT